MTHSKSCLVLDCDKRAKGRYCSMHAERLRVHGSLEKPPGAPRGKMRPDFKPKHGPLCSIPDCGRPSHLRGWCRRHYDRWRDTGEAGGPIEERRPAKGLMCSVGGCDREARQRGWCMAHYQRWYATGEKPTGPIEDQWRRHEWVSYSGMHARLKRESGFACDLPCIDCGNPAADWSYDHRDPEELIYVRNGRPRPYSLDPERYDPRCKSCHIEFDRVFGGAARPFWAARG